MHDWWYNHCEGVLADVLNLYIGRMLGLVPKASIYDIKFSGIC